MSRSLCFIRETSILHDELMQSTDETKTKEAVIALCSIVGESETEQKMIARRLDRMEMDFQKIQKEVKELQAGIKKLADSLGMQL